MSDKQKQLMEYATQDLVAMLVERQGLTLEDAMQRVYHSQFYTKLLDQETGLYLEGSEYLYGLIVQILGRELVYGIEKPSYEKIEQVYMANDVECQLLTLGRDGILSSELKRTAADVLHISPYRSYPSGVTANAAKNELISP